MKKAVYNKPLLVVEQINVELPISTTIGVSSDPDKTIDDIGDFLSKDTFDDFDDLW